VSTLSVIFLHEVQLVFNKRCIIQHPNYCSINANYKKIIIISFRFQFLPGELVSHSSELIEDGFERLFYINGRHICNGMVIYELTRFDKRTDELYEWYYVLIERTMEDITFWNLDEMLNKWSVTIWNAIQEKVKNTDSTDSHH